ncbi:bifunctional serine/threonine-protein kinase/ABC transporter substrate-binding protein [Streptomyces rhizosphaericus]|uniref:ABC transporter substrate-binding protein n=1 Tax=Streptomyces rhizosphaericus TaxID=114699 RepID=A0A6G4AG69_9ACTN|nr:ABC transporter substrate-binding protein [Streptomyces rhizosphaericus]
MKRLLPTDPARLGDHRLLGRLGAGGMGVVYLGRTDAGDLAAVKVIKAEYADDADFRERFRREVVAAREVTSPWVVRVTGADPEAPAPWLATAFVPGPALAEAVAVCGPLPAPAVRTLGSLLARALEAVHAGGLVHRDVKPGNVLLALDGPRLIDFGIARSTSAEVTALTAESVVVGTPGFLSPEQARARHVDTSSDVFSWGCVLAYAATGRPPFGTGAVDALLYRTVHDHPDLDGVADEELLVLLRRCLAKDPDDRPTAAALTAELTRETPDGRIDWLPEPVVSMIAARSAEMLALPAVEPTQADGTGAPDGTSRRRVLTLAATGALLAAVGGTAWWMSRRDESAEGFGTASGRPWVIGVQADLSGPQRALGEAQERAARIAVDAFNSRKNTPFTVTLRVVDDKGSTSGARDAARRLTGDRDVFAVLGPTGFTSTVAALEAYEKAGLALLTVSELCLSSPSSALVLDPRTYFRCAPPNMAGGYMTVAQLATSGSKRAGILMDRAGRLTGRESVQMAYGMAKKYKLDPYVRIVPTAALDPGVVVDDMLAHDIDGLYYSGTAERAAMVARVLAARDFTGPRFLDSPAATDAFPTTAAEAADGWQALASFTSPTATAVRGFATAYRESHGTRPGIWAVEAYDVTRMLISLLTALEEKGGQRPTRSEVLATVRAADYKGVAGTYAFEEDGTFKGGHLDHLRVRDGEWRLVGPVPLT